jgi:hypothetical protein
MAGGFRIRRANGIFQFLFKVPNKLADMEAMNEWHRKVQSAQTLPVKSVSLSQADKLCASTLESSENANQFRKQTVH